MFPKIYKNVYKFQSFTKCIQIHYLHKEVLCYCNVLIDYLWNVYNVIAELNVLLSFLIYCSLRYNSQRWLPVPESPYMRYSHKHTHTPAQPRLFPLRSSRILLRTTNVVFGMRREMASSDTVHHWLVTERQTQLPVTTTAWPLSVAATVAAESR